MTMSGKSLLFAAVCFGLSAAGPASAQSPQRADECILDNCRDRAPLPPGGGRNFDRPQPRDGSGRDGFGRERFGRDSFSDGPRGRGEKGRGSEPGRFDFYVLALSWSPSFCNSEAGRRSREQCAIGARNAFVVHGLWPQFERGYPSYCDDRNPPRFALEQARGVFPEEGLARYQWRKHGSCSGLAPTAYFATVRRARDMVAIPPDLSAPRGPMTRRPVEIQRAFIEANKTLRPGMLAVTCARGQLQEVRICISKDVRRFVACPDVVREACRADSIRLPSPR